MPVLDANIRPATVSARIAELLRYDVVLQLLSASYKD